MAVSSHSSHHPQEVLLTRFSLCVHKTPFISFQLRGAMLSQCWANVLDVGPALRQRCAEIFLWKPASSGDWTRTTGGIPGYSVVVMLGQRLRRWPNITPTLVHRLVLAVIVVDINPSPAKAIYLNFQPLEVVSRYRDPQPQVVKNYSYLFNLRPNIYKYWCLNIHFVPNTSDLFG